VAVVGPHGVDLGRELGREGGREGRNLRILECQEWREERREGGREGGREGSYLNVSALRLHKFLIDVTAFRPDFVDLGIKF